MNQITDKKNQDEHISRFACAEVQKHLPQDLLPQVTVLLQDSGYVTISPRGLERHDWHRIDEKVRQIGGNGFRMKDTVIGASPSPEHGNNSV